MKSSRDRSRRTLQVVPIGVSVLLLIECVGTSAGSRSGDPVREPRLAKHPFQFEATEGAFTYSQFGSSDFPVIEGDCVLQQRTCCGHELWRGTVGSASIALDREWSDKWSDDPRIVEAPHLHTA